MKMFDLTNLLRKLWKLYPLYLNFSENFSEDIEATTKVAVEQLGYSIDDISGDDIKILKFICAVLSVRNASISACFLAVLIRRIGKDNITIAVDGSLYKKHPRLHQLMTDFIAQLCPQQKFKIILAEDGSGKGAAMVAAIAHKLKSI